MGSLAILAELFQECDSPEEAFRILRERKGRWNGRSEVWDVNKKISLSTLGGIKEDCLERIVILFEGEMLPDEEAALKEARSIECFFEEGGAIFITRGNDQNKTGDR
jgi:hypothetical protein